jgi:hypothetical protein
MWLREGLGLNDLAERIETFDCYMYSLEGIRERLIGMCLKEIKQ